MDLRIFFSGAVDALSLKPFLSFQIEDRPVDKVHLVKTDEAHVVEVKLFGVSFSSAEERSISVVLRKGIPLLGHPRVKAPAAQVEVPILDEKPLTILKMVRLEGPSGHFIEVFCNDEAVSEEVEYWDYEDHDSRTASSRCVLDDESAASGIHIEPKLKFSIAPAKRGFRIFADFRRGTYTVRIDGGTRSIDGGALVSTEERSFTFPARSPKLSFIAQGRYLPRAAWKSLPVKHLNLDTLELSVRKIPEHNLVFWMSDDNEAATERTSDLVLKENVPLRGAPDTMTTTFVDLVEDGV